MKFKLICFHLQGSVLPAMLPAWAIPPSLHVLNLQSWCVLLPLLEIQNMTSNQVKIVPVQEERNHWPISTWPSWINPLEAVILFSYTNFPLQNGAPTSQYCQGWTIGQLIAFQSAALWQVLEVNGRGWLQMLTCSMHLLQNIWGNACVLR